MADVLMTLGRTYISLGQLDKAETDLRAALEASLKANGELHPTTAATMGWLGLALANRNKPAEGEKISRKAVELQRKLHPRGHKDLGVALYALGLNLSNKREPKAAQPFLKEASDLIKKHFGATHGFYMTSLITLAVAHERAGEVDAAESIIRQAIDMGGRVESRYRDRSGPGPSVPGRFAHEQGSLCRGGKLCCDRAKQFTVKFTEAMRMTVWALSKRTWDRSTCSKVTTRGPKPNPGKLSICFESTWDPNIPDRRGRSQPWD